MAYEPYNVQPSYPPRPPASPYHQPDPYLRPEPGFDPNHSVTDAYLDDGASGYSRSHTQLAPYDQPYSSGGYAASQSTYFTEKSAPPPMPNYSPALSFSGHSGFSQVQRDIMQRRERRQIPLQNGKLLLDCPVPASITSMAKKHGSTHSEEFTHMRCEFLSCAVPNSAEHRLQTLPSRMMPSERFLHGPPSSVAKRPFHPAISTARGTSCDRACTAARQS